MRARLGGPFRPLVVRLGAGTAGRLMEPYRYLVAGPIWLDCRDERLWLDGKPVRLGGKAVA